MPGGNTPAIAPARSVAKASFDVVASAIMIIVLSPVLLCLTLLCRRDGGPALFAHPRIGTGGRHFKCLKFRTMVNDADRVLARTLATRPDLAAEWAATQKLVNDPRVTRLGRFLRSSSLDELPQLFNVLMLQMSLVGPRPIVEEEVAFYDEDIQYYYATRPGITGMWQISGRSNTSYAERVRLDTSYVINWNFWTDIAVLIKTIPAVLSRKGAY